MIKNCKSQELAKWYEEEALKAYDNDQTAKGDIFMVMADSFRRKTPYERLMDRHDYYIGRAIKAEDTEVRNNLYALAEKAKAQALALPLEASR